jgi:hypothetical protein
LIKCFLVLHVRGKQIFQNYRIHSNTLDARRLTWSNFYNESTKILDASVQNVV